jgi:hypothetical protein
MAEGELERARYLVAKLDILANRLRQEMTAGSPWPGANSD